MADENNMNIEMAESYETSGIDPFDAPTPGASLTSDPENPRAWETPPDYTNQEEALKAIFTNLTDEESHQSLLNTLRDGVDIESIVQVLLFKGFQDGKWSPAQISADGDDWDDDISNEARTAMENDIERMKPKTDSLPPSLLAKMDTFSKGEQ